LYYYIFKTLQSISCIDEIYVICSSGQIKNYIPENIKYLEKPVTSDDNLITCDIEIYKAFLKQVDADVYLFTEATMPLLTSDSILKGLNSVMSSKFDGSFTVSREKIHTQQHTDKSLNYEFIGKVYKTQDLSQDLVFIETRGFNIYSKEALKRDNHTNLNYSPIILNKIEAINIDIYENYLIALSVLHFQNSNKTGLLKPTECMELHIKKTKNIELIIFDFDGCFSDGLINLDYKGRVIKNYYTIDANSVVEMINKKYKIGIISGNSLNFFKKKAKQWGLEFLHGNVKSKLMDVNTLCNKMKIHIDHVAFFGDGLNDISVLNKVGFSGCPNNAHPNVKKVVHYVSPLDGGKGAITDFLSLFP
jgi:3-deoxy-D-manno-octulosonate 8-phosphate phosphatase (KDO 8-P phosphatase)